MPINIRIDAEVEGKKLEFTFNWEGSRNEIEDVMDTCAAARTLRNSGRTVT
jgi:hypothetical protein